MKRKAGLKITTVLPEKTLRKASNFSFVTPYAGNWVVIVGDEVVADGKTARDATSRIPKRIERKESLLFKVPAEPARLFVI